MSANFNDQETGPFDGPFDHASPGPAHEGDHYDVDHDIDYGGDDAPYGEDVAGATPSSGGLELVGGALFLAGFIPAAAVAKALFDGTNLEAVGLGGTAALAATVSKWLGAWPALTTSAVIGILGSLMVLGTLRTDPLRRVAGVAVCGLGLAAIVGALTSSPAQGLLGAGGRIGSGTGGAMADSLGAWAGIVLGLLVMAGAIWLGFGPSAPAVDEDDGMGPILERGESAPRSAGAAAGSAVAWAAGAAVSAGAAAAAAGSALFKRQPRSDSEVVGHRGDRQRRVSNKKVRRTGAPVTLGDALARGGTEGVSHDEAAALAPDDKTLAYMEDVWRRAGSAGEQPEPAPKSPYPEDVRLKGLIPEGAAALEPRRPGDLEDEPEVAQQPQAPAPSVKPVPPAPMPSFGTQQSAGPDVTQFDFEDELSAPKPLDSPPPPVSAPKPAFQSHASDPFGAPAASGAPTEAESDAYREAVRREGASPTAPSDLPDGVKPFTPKPVEVEEAQPVSYSVSEPAADGTLPSVPSVSFSRPENAAAGGDPMAFQAMQAGAMPASVSLPPRPAWEQGYDDDEPAAELEADLLESIPDVDESGRWQRRDDAGESAEPSEPSMSVLDELLAQVDSLEGIEGIDRAAGVDELEVPADSEAATELDAADEVEEASLEAAPAPIARAEEVMVTAPLAEDAALDDDVEGEAELELDAELVDPDAEAAEGEEDEYEEEEYEDEEVDAELEEGEEEEYEYVDEDGNPIDPADLGEEYELVDPDEEDEEADEEGEEDEQAEYEEYEESDEEEDDDEEAAEYEDDEDAEYEEVDGEEDDEEEAAELEEPEAEESNDVVLEPQAPPAASEVAPETPDGLAEAFDAPTSRDGARLREAGRLVVSVDRAAVSVIQKGFDVEFAEACSILEELHAEGLIGPYQEGKKRAILMSLEEWDGRFAHS